MEGASSIQVDLVFLMGNLGLKDSDWSKSLYFFFLAPDLRDLISPTGYKLSILENLLVLRMFCFSFHDFFS